jgi:hypothetical protein
MTIDSTDETFQVVQQVTHDSYVSRMVHIVFLDLTNLHWSNSIFAPPPPPAQNILLKMGIYPKPACLMVPDTTYTWTGTNVAEWDTFNYLTTTRYLYNQGTTTFAAPGWYGNTGLGPGGIARFWNGSEFTNVFSCPLSSVFGTSNLFFGPTVGDVNGILDQIFGQDYDTDGIDFEAATWIEITGTGAAPEGWYRDTVTGVRRYWDGAGFIGIDLWQDFVLVLVPGIYYSLLPAGQLCSTSGIGTLRTTFVESDTNFISANFADYAGDKLYVNLSWAGGSSGMGPLMTAVAMNPPGSNIKYKTAYRNSIWDGANNTVLAGKTIATLDQTLGYISSILLCP